jgi:FkbM family methyltransferase
MGLKSWFMQSPFYDFLGKRSFAQAGEDIIAVTELGKVKKGFYVDIGAYHPKQFSNTYLFYKKGWRGIVVEPNSEMVRLHKRVRPGDIQLNVGVGNEKKVMDYIQMNEPATNTFVVVEAEKGVERAGRKIVGRSAVAILPLKEILDKNLPPGKEIDLLSVDTEGMDLEVLKSNDWSKYRPEIVICEDMDFDIKDWKRSKVALLLDQEGYRLVSQTPYSLIFRLK